MRKLVKYPIIILSVLVILFLMVVIGIPFILANDWNQTAMDSIDLAMDINKTVSETVNPYIVQIRNDSEGLYEKRLGDIEQEEREEISIFELLPEPAEVLDTLNNSKKAFDETTRPLQDKVLGMAIENYTGNDEDVPSEPVDNSNQKNDNNTKSENSNTEDNNTRSSSNDEDSNTKSENNNTEDNNTRSSSNDEDDMSPLDKYMQYKQGVKDPNTGCANCKSNGVTQIISASMIKIGGEIIKIANVNIGDFGVEYDNAIKIIRTECGVGTTATYESLNTLGDGTVVAYLWCNNAQIGNITQSMNTKLS